jgi:type VI protein secretion system component VasF
MAALEQFSLLSDEELEAVIAKSDVWAAYRTAALEERSRRRQRCRIKDRWPLWWTCLLVAVVWLITLWMFATWSIIRDGWPTVQNTTQWLPSHLQ